ncbi:hypothetical protein [Streptomyces sp. NPDC058394]|uniref:hypothetical protein n=1 Tax=Streptomyces sp. NPDC058394 TaxID=3346477 RepID=UPI00365182CD
MAGTSGSLSPVPALPVVGCGLTGDGTAGMPITANPVAGQAAWADIWDCEDATYSTGIERSASLSAARSRLWAAR